MGSIAYITDKNMMEYHRLHGNSVINFWKPSIKSITDFKKGDMLFFLTKGTERGKKKRKGNTWIRSSSKATKHGVYTNVECI